MTAKKRHTITNDTDLIVNDDFDATPDSLVAEEYHIDPAKWAAILDGLERKGRWRGQLVPMHPPGARAEMTTIKLPDETDRAFMDMSAQAIREAEEGGNPRAAAIRQLLYGHKDRSAERAKKRH